MPRPVYVLWGDLNTNQKIYARDHWDGVAQNPELYQYKVIENSNIVLDVILLFDEEVD